MPRKKPNELDIAKPKDAFIMAYKKHLGHISKACNELNMSRHTFYNWLRDDADFAAQVATVEEELLDDVEEALKGCIKQGFKTIKRTNVLHKDGKNKIISSTEKVEVTQQGPDPALLMRYLERKAPHRGWAKDNPIQPESEVKFDDE